jgi:hypothetical protein
MAKFGGLLPLLCARALVLSWLKTTTEVVLFGAGLLLLRSLPPWELFFASLAASSVVGVAFSRFQQGNEAAWRIGRHCFLIPSALLYLFGWGLYRWYGLAPPLYKAGLTVFLVSAALTAERIERELTESEAISLIRATSFLLLPISLSLLFHSFFTL